MLNDNELKHWLQKELKRADKLLLILATFERPVSLGDIKTCALNVGFKFKKTENLSAALSGTKGLAIRLPTGWEITDLGRAYLHGLGVTSSSVAAKQVAVDIRNHLDKIINPTTRSFVDEAIKCHESRLHRAAIVMSWLAAVDVLHRVVVKNHLNSFNELAKSLDSRWKNAVNEDGVGRMGEEAFLDRCAALGIIGKNQKEELLKCLKLRNGCGHPNSLRVGPNAVASHLEILILNVFENFDV